MDLTQTQVPMGSFAVSTKQKKLFSLWLQKRRSLQARQKKMKNIMTRKPTIMENKVRVKPRIGLKMMKRMSQVK
jgi:hypothetical protein